MDDVKSVKRSTPGRYLRIRQLASPHGVLPVSRSTIWAWVKAGTFPAPIKLGPRVTVFDREAVMAFIADRHSPKS